MLESIGRWQMTLMLENEENGEKSRLGDCDMKIKREWSQNLGSSQNSDLDDCLKKNKRDHPLFVKKH